MRKWAIPMGIVALLVVAAGGVALAPHDRYGDGTKAVFFGDSWTEGYSAEPHTKGFAYLAGEQLGWDSTVDGQKGTGYSTGGTTGVRYIDRMKTRIDTTARVLILQGGLNDENQPIAAVEEAVGATLDAAKIHYPNSLIVVLGPAPSSMPVTSRLSAVDTALADATSARNIRYISPIAETWITSDNWADVISVEGLYHPSTAGHAYLASRLVYDLAGKL